MQIELHEVILISPTPRSARDHPPIIHLDYTGTHRLTIIRSVTLHDPDPSHNDYIFTTNIMMIFTRYHFIIRIYILYQHHHPFISYDDQGVSDIHTEALTDGRTNTQTDTTTRPLTPPYIYAS